MKLTHVRLLVQDFATSFRFYRDAMGLEVRHGSETGEYAEFRAGDTVIALFDRAEMSRIAGTTGKPAAPESQDAAVLCIEVHDVDAVFGQLRRKGVEVVTEPVDRVDWGIRTAHVRAPEGTLIEVNRELSINRELS